MKPKILKAHYDILPQAQYNVLSELRKMPSEFVLYGGTAIALHLGHRSSVDFDLFSSVNFQFDKLKASLSFLGIQEILQAETNTLKDILIQASREVSLDKIEPSPLEHWSLA